MNMLNQKKGLNPTPLNAQVDEWLATLSQTDLKLIIWLFVAATESPDGLVAQSIEEIAAATGLSLRTVHTHLHDLATPVIDGNNTTIRRRTIQIASQEKESTLIRVLGARVSGSGANAREFVTACWQTSGPYQTAVRASVCTKSASPLAESVPSCRKG